MATYKEIRVVNIQSLESDPTAVEGDVWYNASTSKLKMYAAAGAWATGGTAGSGRYSGNGTGTIAAGLYWGGQTGGNNNVALTETYDGTSWAEVGDLNNARHLTGQAGTQTAALAAGGQGNEDKSEEWDASSCTEGSSMSNARCQTSG